MCRRVFATLVLSTLLLLSLQATAVETGDPQLDEAFGVLLGKNFAAKGPALATIASSNHAKAEPLLRAVLEGRLRLEKQSQRLVFTEKKGRSFLAVDAFNDTPLGEFKSRALKKIKINNALRGQLRALLANRQLNNPDPAARLKAVQTMLDKPDPTQLDALSERLEQETDGEVRAALELLLALSRLDADQPAQRIAAITAVGDSLEPVVRNRLTELAASDPDPGVKKAASLSLKAIEDRIEIYAMAETIFFGLSLGSVLVLAAIGLAITFGVMGVINMAHGELIMLGAYTTYLIQQALPDHIGISVVLAIPAAFLVSGCAGMAIERGVIRFLYGRPLETLLATFGISLILQQMVRTLISPQNVPVANPEWMSGFLEINSVLSLTYNRLYIMLFCVLVFAALFLVLKRTRLGLEVRAVSQNRPMARAMGVHSNRVDMLTFGLGSGIAGVAGVALSQLTNVGPNLGQAYIVDSFMVVVFGGVGNLWGTMIGGLGLGVANKFLEPWSGAVLAKILILVFIILFIQKRPRGLFPQKGRAAEG